jgi:hypothetical protein
MDGGPRATPAARGGETCSGIAAKKGHGWFFGAERFSCRAALPLSTIRLSWVDEAKSMTEKQL